MPAVPLENISNDPEVVRMALLWSVGSIHESRCKDKCRHPEPWLKVVSMSVITKTPKFRL